MSVKFKIKSLTLKNEFFLINLLLEHSSKLPELSEKAKFCWKSGFKLRNASNYKFLKPLHRTFIRVSVLFPD